MEPATVEVKPLKPEITFDDFSKLDIRIGKVLAAEKMEKSNKLLKLTIDTGVDKRTVLSGIAQHFSPEEMVGKQVTLIANLAPRKMMGIESQGMVLMAEDGDGKLKLTSNFGHGVSWRPSLVNHFFSIDRYFKSAPPICYFNFVFSILGNH